MLLTLRVICLINYLVIKSFEKEFMHHLVMSYIVVYYIIIISYILDKIAKCIKLDIINDCLILFTVH